VVAVVGAGSIEGGDADLSALGAALADRARARILLTLADGRALPASVLAAEAGVAASTASAHLARLLEARLVTVYARGRHRYYALAGHHVGELLECLARLAPATPMRSLREGTRARALRLARTCYDHIAGRVGVAVFGTMLDQGLVVGGDGRFHPDSARLDRFSGPGQDVHYRLTTAGRRSLVDLGVTLPPAGHKAMPLQYCVDWTEQAHHLSGSVGRALQARLIELGWFTRLPRGRALRITPAGIRGLADRFGIAVADL
jgi:DNA-binding transcriptional ArsR family regulator